MHAAVVSVHQKLGLLFGSSTLMEFNHFAVFVFHTQRPTRLLPVSCAATPDPSHIHRQPFVAVDFYWVWIKKKRSWKWKKPFRYSEKRSVYSYSECTQRTFCIASRFRCIPPMRLRLVPTKTHILVNHSLIACLFVYTIFSWSSSSLSVFSFLLTCSRMLLIDRRKLKKKRYQIYDSSGFLRCILQQTFVDR